MFHLKVYMELFEIKVLVKKNERKALNIFLIIKFFRIEYVLQTL